MLLLIGFGALSIAAVVAHRAPATGYELSLYSATPTLVWLCLAVAFFTSLVSSVTTSSRYLRGSALVLGGATTFTVVALPVLRGYYFYGSADPMTHLGWAKDISSGVLDPANLFYPGLHTAAVILHETLGYSLRLGILVAILCFTAIFLVFVPLCVRYVTGSERATVVAAFSTFLLLPINNISMFLRAHPFSQTLFFSALVFYLLFKFLTEETTGSKLTPIAVILGVASVATVIYHPQLSVHLLAVFASVTVLQYLYRLRGTDHAITSHRSMLAHTLLLAGAVVAWITGRPAFRAQIESISLAAQGYLRGNPPTPGGRVASQGTSITAIGGSLPEMYLKLFLPTTVFAVLAGVAVLASYTSWINFRSEHDAVVRYFVLSVLGVLPLFVLYFAGSIAEMYFRTFGFIVLLLLIAGAVSLFNVFEGVADRYGSTTFALGFVVLFAVLTPVSLATAYQSPYIYKANQHVTESQFSGYEATFEYGADGIDVTSLRQSATRYSDGVEGYQNSGRYDRSISGTNLTQLDAAAEKPMYVVLSTYDVQREVNAYRELRYSRAELNAVENQRGVDRVLTNGDLRLYLVGGNETQTGQQ
ncbi:hypothetical protein ACFR9U_15200 [Halorientalis brevis]|uniref:Glycosyltransferase RgtA/B/C/D-like domain-containing protein n=1 Tax=Halorientalis brevis TaxID=1126241 RepID=A0ABD6CGI1_9EURY|nr:hypothetical protein [Halorientalis brevis]